jgi:hypothetical protein
MCKHQVCTCVHETLSKHICQQCTAKQPHTQGSQNVRNSIMSGETLDPKLNSYMRRVIQEELSNEPVNFSAFNYL